MYQALFCLGLLAPAADPVPPPPLPPPPALLAPAPVGVPCPACPAGCAVESVVVKVPRVVFDCKCAEYCLPHRSLWKTLLGCGDEALCCEPKVRHQLVKKVVIEEKCVPRCVKAGDAPGAPLVK